MSYELDALLGRAEDAGRWKREWPGLVVVPISTGLALVPLTAEQTALLGSPESWASLGSPVAHLSASYFGGVGGHDCDLWVDGRKVGRGLDINEVLEHFGIKAESPQDAFDTVDLGRFRSTEMWLAEAVLAEASTPDLLLTLLERDPRPLLRGKAAKKLEEVEDPRITAALTTAMRSDPDYGVRLSASGALALRGPDGAAALTEALDVAPPDDLWGLLHSLGKMGLTAQSSGVRILPLLGHTDWRIRIEAARTLGLCGVTEAVEALRRLEKDPEALVCSAAREALNRLF